MPDRSVATCGISVIIPVYNELDSLELLTRRTMTALSIFENPEIIFVNDGSTDGSLEKIRELVSQNPKSIKMVSFRRNFGKSLALRAGFDRAKGQYVAMMDADLQDQPEEIPRLINHLNTQGLDVVTGWKKQRMDPWSKTIPSKFFNGLLGHFTGLSIHDFNCGIKVFKKECLKSLLLYGHLHRFILVLLSNKGFRIGEMEVDHAPRQFGQSKYGVERIYYGSMDILSVFFLTRYVESPLYFFGLYGLSAIMLGIPIGIFFIAMHFISFFTGNRDMRLHKHPLWFTSPILLLIGLVIIFFGLIGELITYYMMAQNPSRDLIREELGFDGETLS
ncbi:MAG: glycosyltransferase family 2 protein [Candidatus Riflebacteria bacterium]|nr:glycosyltransferase family 2 protein [Candidatus Riflebacteria bacterium]